MHTFAQKQSRSQQGKSSDLVRPAAAASPRSHEARTLHHWQYTIKNPGLQPLRDTNELEADCSTATSTRFGHDFSRVPVHAKAIFGIQAKRTVSTPGDAYEQEADRVADQVLRMSVTGLQRTCACGGECNKCKSGQLTTGAKQPQLKQSHASEAAVPSVVQEVLHSSGQPLDAETRAFFEPRFGHDFGHVRLHTGESAAQSAHTLDASAYTAGNNIVFSNGKYAPETNEGKRLLAHELTHVIQQRSVASSPINVPVPHTGGLNVVQRKVDECPEWTPVNDARVRNLIRRARRTTGHDVPAAGDCGPGGTFGEIIRERNRDEHCCDLSYAAADHYFVVMCGASTCLEAQLMALLSPGRRLFSEAGNCPVSPIDSDVMRWEQQAAEDFCFNYLAHIVSTEEPVAAGPRRPGELEKSTG
jgi:hypothetical protein